MSRPDEPVRTAPVQTAAPGGPGPGREPSDGADLLAEPMRSRWSPSVFDPEHVVDDDQVAVLLQAARWSPSLGNTQPWSYVVAPRGSAAHDVAVRHLTRGNATWVPRASLLLLGAVQVGPDPDGQDVPSPDYARYDLGQATAHLTLQAQAMGLHTHQYAGYDAAATAADLGVPDHVVLMAGVAIGVPGDPALATERDREKQARPRARRPLATYAHSERWGLPWGGLGQSVP